MRPSDVGAGVVSTFMGAVVFLLFLLFAAQLLLGLHTESVVGAVAYDAAKTVAGGAVVTDPLAPSRATDLARRRLGRLGADASFSWSVDDDAVLLTVRVPRPPILFGMLPMVRGPIQRTVQVRAERWR